MLNPIPWYPDHALLDSERVKFNEAIEILARTYGCRFVDMNSAIKADQTVDGLHPNAAGHQMIFERMKNVLEKEQYL